jgi:cell division transport system permease protein
MSNNSEKILKNSIFSIKSSMIFTMTIALLSIGFVIFTSLFSNRLIQILQEEIPFKIILNESSSTEVFDLMSFLKKNKEVNIKKTQFVQKDLAATELKQKLGQDFLAPLSNENPLPDIINLYIKSEYHNIQSLKKIKNNIETHSSVSSVIFPVKISDRLINIKSKILIISLVISVIFLFFSILLIHNNIRLTIYANRYTLKVMQLVGATKHFIQQPFLKRSVLDGFLAALISTFILGAIVFTILYISFESNDLLIEKLLSIFSILELGLVCIFIIFSGILISLISHWLVLRKILSLKINFYK